MKLNEEYWLNLYYAKLIDIDFETGLVYSNLTKTNPHRKIGYKGSNGYIFLTAHNFPSYHISAHRLMWIVFKGEIPQGYEVNHINGDKEDNRLCNLEIMTKSQNHLHRYYVLEKKGIFLAGENSLCSKLTWKEVLDIRWLFAEGVRIVDIAKDFGVKSNTICNIVYNKRWNRENVEEMIKCE